MEARAKPAMDRFLGRLLSISLGGNPSFFFLLQTTGHSFITVPAETSHLQLSFSLHFKESLRVLSLLVQELFAFQFLIEKREKEVER
jgi:hypothetical protein